eukprot:g24500.t1
MAALVPGLEDELRNAGLERCLVAAAEWCDRMGPKDMEEISEEERWEAPLMVKNTFLELDEGARSEALQRANTVPAPASNVQDLLEDEEEEEELRIPKKREETGRNSKR